MLESSLAQAVLHGQEVAVDRDVCCPPKPSGAPSNYLLVVMLLVLVDVSWTSMLTAKSMKKYMVSSSKEPGALGLCFWLLNWFSVGFLYFLDGQIMK